MQTVPRLIVVDLDIKWLSGRQLIEVLRRNPRTSLIPIVAVGGAVEDACAASRCCCGRGRGAAARARVIGSCPTTATGRHM